MCNIEKLRDAVWDLLATAELNQDELEPDTLEILTRTYKILDETKEVK